MRTVCAMIVGHGEDARYLEQTMIAAKGWADRIMVYLDHPDLQTYETAVEYANATALSPSLSPSFLEDESYVRNRLMTLLDTWRHGGIRVEGGDLIVALDADEELRADGGVEDALARCRADKAHDAWQATFYHLWDEEGTKVRVDGGWAPAPQHRIYRHRAGGRLPERKLACGAIPERAKRRSGEDMGLRVLHWGYSRPEDRVAKHRRYAEIDGGKYHSAEHLRSIVKPGTLVSLSDVGAL